MDIDLCISGTPRELVTPPNTPVALYDVNRVIAFNEYLQLTPLSGQWFIHPQGLSEFYYSEPYRPYTEQNLTPGLMLYDNAYMDALSGANEDGHRLQKVKYAKVSPMNQFHCNQDRNGESEEELYRIAKLFCVESKEDSITRHIGHGARKVKFAKVFPSIGSACKSYDELDRITALFRVETQTDEMYNVHLKASKAQMTQALAQGDFESEHPIAEENMSLTRVGTMGNEIPGQNIVSRLESTIRCMWKKMKATKVSPSLSDTDVLQELSKEQLDQLTALFCVESPIEAALRGDEGCRNVKYNRTNNTEDSEVVSSSKDTTEAGCVGKPLDEKESKGKRKSWRKSLVNVFLRLKHCLTRG